MQKVTWFNMPATDFDKIADFYNTVFGWELRPMVKAAKEDLDFRTIRTATDSTDMLESREPGVINGCLVRRDIGLAHPTILIDVDNIEDKITEIIAAGGTVVREKTTIPEAGGSFAFVKDPEGNVFEIWEPLKN